MPSHMISGVMLTMWAWRMLASIDNVGHLHARVKLVGLHLHGEDGDGGGFHVFEDGGGHVDERTRREVFEDKGVEGTAALGELGRDGGGDGLSDAVGDERDLLVGLNAQAGEDGGAGAGDEFGRVGLRQADARRWR